MPPNLLLLVVLVFALPASALAQSGGIIDGMHHDPKPGPVHAKEEAAGIAPPPAQQRVQTNQVDSIYNQLMSKEKPGGGPGPSAPSVAPLQPGAAPAK